MSRPIAEVEVAPEEEKELRRRVNASSSAKRDSLRAQIVLLRMEGRSQDETAAELNTSRQTVNKWSQRFDLNGLEGLKDSPGRGRKPSLPPEKINEVITNATKPPPKRKRWSSRAMAKEVGFSHMSVHRIWSQNDIKPHRLDTFKVSKDPRFEEKFWDVIGLYLDPPERGLVLCCDEKSQCQALERTQPGLPLGIGHIQTQTHDYKRHGTITLFAALNYLDGKLIARTEKRHTHVEWLRFLKQIDRTTSSDLDIHLIVDNYATHKHKKVRQWLDKHPRFHVHFTPTSSSWLNLVERFFAELSEDVIRYGSFASVNELIRDIEDYLADRNAEPKPYHWKASGEEILRKVQRAREKLREQEECS